MTKTTDRCEATTRSGGRCLKKAMHGSLFCMAHDPDRAEERSRIARQGGQGARGRSR